jgi:hypothetical protein
VCGLHVLHANSGKLAPIKLPLDVVAVDLDNNFIRVPLNTFTNKTANSKRSDHSNESNSSPWSSNSDGDSESKAAATPGETTKKNKKTTAPSPKSPRHSSAFRLDRDDPQWKLQQEKLRCALEILFSFLNEHPCVVYCDF